MSSNKPTIAFFDFDGTLTKGDTLMPFLKFVVGSWRYYLNLVMLSPVLVGYFLKLVRNDQAKEAVLTRFLRGYKIDDLFELGAQFSDQVIPSMLRPEGMEKLRWHQSQGHECVLVSASFDVWLNSWSESQKMCTPITSHLQVKDGVVTGQLDGKNCFGEEKVKRIETQYELSDFDKSYGYGDTRSDRYFLELCNIAEFI